MPSFASGWKTLREGKDGIFRRLKQVAPLEGGAEKGFKLLLKSVIRIANPANIGINGEGGGDGLAVGVSDDDTEFAGNEFGAEIVRVAADAKVEAAPIEQGFHEGADVSHKAIVSRHEFV